MPHFMGWLPPVRRVACTLLLTPLASCSLWPADAPDSNRTLPGEKADTALVDPKLARPQVSVRKIKPQDYEVGLYLGGIAISRNYVTGFYGLRAGYHLTENFWTEIQYASASKTGFDEAASILGVNQPPKVDYDSYGVSAGYDLLPGDLYISNRYTLPIALYAVGGIGEVHYGEYASDSSFLAYDLGGGLKLMPRDWLTIRVELRNQLWDRSKTEQNLEFSFGLAAFF